MLLGLRLIGQSCGATSTHSSTGHHVVIDDGWLHHPEEENHSNIMTGSAIPRSKAYPEGKPGLSAKDRRIVAHANRITSNCFKLIRARCLANKPWSLENPVGSLLWSTRAWKSIAREFKPKKVVVDYCRYGALYRKRTTLMTWDASRPDFLRTLELRCRCVGKHRRLGNWGEQRKLNWPTARGSAAYPDALCTAWAHAVRNHVGR